MVEQRVQRRLAAILAADVAGYSRLMGKDEEGTLATLTAHLKELIEPCIAEHRGRVVKTTGDGLLAEFASVVDAIRCAIVFQEGMMARNTDTPEASRIEFRIGVNLGDVIVQDDDVYGDGVNVAARLEGLATPGKIVVSGMVHEAVKAKLDIRFDDLGPQEVKNIAEPVRAYSVSPEVAQNRPQHAVSANPLPLPDKPSIAVLAFDNMSGDPEQEYFSDGITEDIITALSRISWFFVTARNSSFTYKGKAVDAKQVGRDLGVRYLLEGSVRKAGQRLRISAQLIDALTGNHVWAEHYDRDLSDVFAVQDEITRNVVASTHTQVQLQEGSYFEYFERPSLPVWALTNRAWQLLYELTPAALAEATRLAQEAITLDPDNGRAHQTLAVMRWHTYWMGFADDLPQLLKDAHESATTALRLKGHDEYGFWIHGLILMSEESFDRAVAELERAIDINPNCSLAYGSLGTVLNFAGRPKESIANNEIAIRSNPRDPSIFFRYSGLALSYFLLEDYESAIQWAQKATQQKRDWFQGYAVLSASYAALDRLVESESAVREYLAEFPSATSTDMLRIPFKRVEYGERLVDALRKAGLPE